jgi:membrane protein
VSKLSEIWILLREGTKAFFEDAAHSRGAAISFYAMTAMGPVLYITAWVAGIFLGSKAAHIHLVEQVRRVISTDTAEMLQAAIAAAGQISGGSAGTLAGVALLLFTAGGVFVEVQSALNCIWKTPAPPFSWRGMAKSYLFSLAMVGGLGLLLCLSLLVNTMVGAFGTYFESLIGVDGGLVWLLNTAVSASLITFLFAAIYRVLPNRTLEWGDVIHGAVITAVLILIGEYAIAFYLSQSALSHRYGSAGGAMAFLLWLYYSSQVFLLGAEITKVWSQRHGSPAAKAAAHEVRLKQAA